MSKYDELLLHQTHRKMLIGGTLLPYGTRAGKARIRYESITTILFTFRKFPPRKPATTTITGHTAGSTSNLTGANSYSTKTISPNPLFYGQKALGSMQAPFETTLFENVHLCHDSESVYICKHRKYSHAYIHYSVYFCKCDKKCERNVNRTAKSEKHKTRSWLAVASRLTAGVRAGRGAAAPPRPLSFPSRLASHFIITLRSFYFISKCVAFAIEVRVRYQMRLHSFDRNKITGGFVMILLRVGRSIKQRSLRS